jgi:predicted Zn-dependent protease
MKRAWEIRPKSYRSGFSPKTSPCEENRLETKRVPEILAALILATVTSCASNGTLHNRDLLKQSSEDIRNHRLSEAQAILDQLKTTLPENPAVWNNLATVAFLQKDYSLALAMMDNALSLRPTNPDLRMNKARLLLAMGQNEEARLLLRRMIRLRPWPKGYRILLAIAEKKTGHREAARILFEEMIANHPDDPLAQKYLSSFSAPGNNIPPSGPKTSP